MAGAGGYNETILDHFRNPRNVGEMPDADVRTTEGSPACGDQITLYLKVNPETRVIERVTFRSYGCASNIATGSVITEMVTGKTLEEAKRVTWQEANARLGGLPAVKVHCAVLAVDALHAAIERYELEHGLAPSPEPTTAESLRRRLKRVIDPRQGQDIVSTGLLLDLRFEEGVVTVRLGLSGRHQFAANLKEEVTEKLGFLPDVKEVRVVFEEEGLS